MLVVNEVFFSIRGEGTRAGQPCVFVRLTGCPLRCTWCDTAYAFEEGTRRDEGDVMRDVASHPCRLVQLTGGEPLAQPAAFPFVDDGLPVRLQVQLHEYLWPGVERGV